MQGKRFEVTILAHFCKGCGLCVEFCEQGKLYIEKRPNRRGVQTAAVRPDVDCTGCLQCATICPDAAIEISRVEAAAASAPGTEQDQESR